MAYAIDKPSATLKATYDIMKTASQSGLVMPLRADQLPPPYTAENTVIPFDLAKSGQLLDDAGYKKGADAMRTNKDGSPLKIDFSVQHRLHRLRGDGRRDHQQLQAARPGRQGDQVAAGLGRPAEKSGKFDMMINFVGSGCDYANGLGATLDSSQFPTTTSVKGNVERFSDPKVGAAVKALTGTTDKAAIKQQVGVLADTMMTQFPVMPILYAPARGIYRTDQRRRLADRAGSVRQPAGQLHCHHDPPGPPVVTTG